jgi:hypothetical protein
MRRGRLLIWSKMRSTTILLIVENEGETVRLLHLRIWRHILRRYFDRQILPFVIVVYPRGDVANCVIVIGILECLQYQRGGVTL